MPQRRQHAGRKLRLVSTGATTEFPKHWGKRTEGHGTGWMTRRGKEGDRRGDAASVQSEGRSETWGMAASPASAAPGALWETQRGFHVLQEWKQKAASSIIISPLQGEEMFSPHTFQVLISKSHSPPYALVSCLIHLSRQSINTRVHTMCWNLNAQEGGLTGQLGGKIPENIPIIIFPYPISAEVLFIWPVLIRNCH